MGTVAIVLIIVAASYIALDVYDWYITYDIQKRIRERDLKNEAHKKTPTGR